MISRGLHQADACTKRGLAPSRGLHQAEACTKRMLAPSRCLHQADACTKQRLAPSGGLHQAGACTKQRLAPSGGLHQAEACTKQTTISVGYLQGGAYLIPSLSTRYPSPLSNSNMPSLPGKCKAPNAMNAGFSARSCLIRSVMR